MWWLFFGPTFIRSLDVVDFMLLNSWTKAHKLTVKQHAVHFMQVGSVIIGLAWLISPKSSVFFFN